MNRADLSWVLQGIQTLIRPQNQVRITANVCDTRGGNGIFYTLNRIAKREPKVDGSEPKTLPSRMDTQAAQAARNEVPLLEEGGTFKVPVTINDSIKLNFTVDSGAADVSIPADVMLVMIRTGTLSEGDFTGTQTYQLADGTKVPSKTFTIRTLKVGNKTIENVKASMAKLEGHLLLGQSFLSRFESVSFDYNRQVLILK